MSSKTRQPGRPLTGAARAPRFWRPARRREVTGSTPLPHRPLTRRLRRPFAAAVAVLAALLAGAAPAGADTIAIDGYDVYSTPVNGYGGWNHTYGATQTPLGRTIATGPTTFFKLYDYTGAGSGTMNDGVFSANNSSTHLLVTGRIDSAGQPVTPVIVLHLPAPAFVDSVSVYGGDIDFNAIPGALSSLTVEVPGASASAVPGQPFGYEGVFGPVNDRFDLAGTAVPDVATDTVVLRDFVAASFFAADQFSVSEVVVEGRNLALEVGVEVKPGAAKPTIVAGAPGFVPVAVLSSETFDAVTQLAPQTVTFGRTGTEASVRSWSFSDANGDGLRDVLLRVAAAATGFTVGDTAAVLRGHTTSGGAVQGSDQIRVIAAR